MMVHDRKHYSPGSAELIFGGISTGVKNLLVIFDSGSSYSYLQFEPYQAFISLVEKELSGKPLRKANDDNTLPLCWKGRKAFKSVQDAKQYFKPFALSFAKGWKGRSQFEIPPESYLIISSKGNVCLGVLNGSEAGLHDVNIIGDISMQDKMVIYDNEKKSIGWTPAKCDQPPKSSNIQM
nr:aspartic proteinase Asp1 [Ipomoea batatas]